jgi:hypothetical protein
MADFYPKTDGDKVTFLNSFMNGFSVEAVGLGLLPADITALGTAVSAYQTAVGVKATAKAAAQSSGAACAATEATTQEALRAMVRRIKASPTYTQAIGELLGIERGTTSSSSTTSRPDLQANSVLNAEVELSFIKNGFTGVEIECRRGAEVDFRFLARDTEAPYIDNRANLTSAPETRQYRARYLQKDLCVGEFSDVLVVTVPGTV